MKTLVWITAIVLFALQASGHPPVPGVRTSFSQNNPFRIERALPQGYVKDGSVDYTWYVQSAIQRYDHIVFPGFPILINDQGLLIGSNKRIVFEKGAEIRLKPTSLRKYKILHLRNASNVVLVNPVIKGDRFSHLASDGEHGIGISINGGRNITLINPVVRETWGDGIYIGAYQNTPPQNITVDRAYISKAGRNGISIISGINVKLLNPYCEYADRLNPMAGIDIEPNGASDQLKNISIINPVTFKNGTTGIQIGLSKFYNGTAAQSKSISIDVENHLDEGSKNGVWLSTAAKSRSKGAIVSGTLNFINPQWKNNELPIKGRTLSEPNIRFSLTNPKIISGKNGRGIEKALSRQEMQDLFLRNVGRVSFYPRY